MQGWAEAVMADAAALPDERYAEEDVARHQALALLREAQKQLTMVRFKVDLCWLYRGKLRSS